MKKADLVSSLSQKHKLPRGKAQAVIEDLFEELAAALVRDDTVDLRGFGTFSLRRAKARVGRNPQTGEAIAIPARLVPDFRPGKELLERCNPADEPSVPAAKPAQDGHFHNATPDEKSPARTVTSSLSRRAEQDRQTL